MRWRALAAFSRSARLTLRLRRYPAFRHPRWFQGHPFHEPGHPYTPGGDIAWLRPDGREFGERDWHDARSHVLGMLIDSTSPITDSLVQSHFGVAPDSTSTRKQAGPIHEV